MIDKPIQNLITQALSFKLQRAAHAALCATLAPAVKPGWHCTVIQLDGLPNTEVHWKAGEVRGEIDDWHIYASGSNIDLADFFAGYDSIIAMIEKLIEEAGGWEVGEN